jgi:hypothetical protein
MPFRGVVMLHQELWQTRTDEGLKMSDGALACASSDQGDRMDADACTGTPSPLAAAARWFLAVAATLDDAPERRRHALRNGLFGDAPYRA